jgi:hypothetical protein
MTTSWKDTYEGHILTKRDWDTLVLGSYNQEQIQKAVADSSWQDFRQYLWDLSLYNKYAALQTWLEDQGYSEKSKVQVTNFVNALKRGGLIK